MPEIHVTTQILAGAGKKLHLFHHLYEGDNRLLATGEHMLLHVDMNSRASSLPGARLLPPRWQISCAPMPDCRHPTGLTRDWCKIAAKIVQK